MKKSIPTVAFGFMNPESVRIVFKFRGNFDMCLATDQERLAELKPDRREHNMVVLPNFAKRHELAQYADRIGYLIVLAKGQHEEVLAHNIPILDASMVDGELRIDRSHTPTYFMKKIPEAAVPLELDEPEPTKVRRTAEKLPTSVDHWFEVMKGATLRKGVFSVDVEQPTALYLVGELSRKEFKAALQAAVRQGLNRELVRDFYYWLSEKRAETYVKAMKAYLWPKKIDKAPSALRVAKHFDIPMVDVGVIEQIYAALEDHQGEETDVEEEEAGQKPQSTQRKRRKAKGRKGRRG